MEYVDISDYKDETIKSTKLTMKVFGVKEDNELQPIDKFNVSCVDVTGILPEL